MSSTDWSFLANGLDQATLDRGVTTGLVVPNGGSSFVYAFNSLVVATGAVGLFNNQSNFAPTPANKGARVQGAIKRCISAGPIGFAPFFYLLCQGNSVNDSCYMLGLEDDNPYHISMRKGQVVNGLPAAVPGESGVLRRSTATFSPDTWHHFRFDAIVNANGDVILKAWSNDLTANAVGSPVWVPIPGIEDSSRVASHGAGVAFVDDNLGINSGSQPYTSGRNGFAMRVSDTTRRAAFDHVEVHRQT